MLVERSMVGHLFDACYTLSNAGSLCFLRGTYTVADDARLFGIIFSLFLCKKDCGSYRPPVSLKYLYSLLFVLISGRNDGCFSLLVRKKNNKSKLDRLLYNLFSV